MSKTSPYQYTPLKSSPEWGGALKGRRGPTCRLSTPLLETWDTSVSCAATSPFRGGFDLYCMRAT
jgi:hypothetical protein